MTLSITSTAFDDGAAIPRVFTCQGEDLSPPLQWSGVPDGARSLALIVDDPDAPDPAAPKMTWSHWVLYNLPADSTGLPQAAAALPAGTVDGINDWKRTGYGGPCPPIGRHRYFFRLYALDTNLTISDPATRERVLEAIEGHVVESAVLMGTYEKD